jgi:hypothetical protein
MKDHPAVLKYAHEFARTSGVELDDLLQEARIAQWKAQAAGSYDPHLASLDTFVTTGVYRAMCSAVPRLRRGTPPSSEYQVELSIDLSDQSGPPPDRSLLLAELIRELPVDARAVVELVLDKGDAGILVDQVLANAKGARDRLRSYVRRVLGLRRGDRAEAAFSAVTNMLAELSV